MSEIGLTPQELKMAGSSLVVEQGEELVDNLTAAINGLAAKIGEKFGYDEINHPLEIKDLKKNLYFFFWWKFTDGLIDLLKDEGLLETFKKMVKDKDVSFKETSSEIILILEKNAARGNSGIEAIVKDAVRSLEERARSLIEEKSPKDRP